ncbi:outer membrane protein assembly factor BamE [Halomonas elongata]|uniref:outer membrane protein assembly factor BamE n=1 Tax=Halomonas elongata TaxID=2746 RepID=UPI0023B06DE4|nr:outer membrane protein assembly factor BamE [Halomonas elongata]
MLNGCSGMGGGDRFPDPHDAYMQGGTLEASRAIQTVHSGMTKDQVRDLLGNPHFSEGLINVRTWDYLFDLSDHGRLGSMMCQFQLLFDESMRVESMQWRTARCATRFSAIEAEPIEGKSVLQHYRLPIAGVFSAEGDLTDEGRRLLDEFASLLQRDFRTPSLSLASYPDPGRYRMQRQAVRRFLLARDGASAEDVTLTSESTSPCREDDGVDQCRRMEQIVIEVRES